MTADVWILISVDVCGDYFCLFFGFVFSLISVEVERNARQNKIAIHDLRSTPLESPTGSTI